MRIGRGLDREWRKTAQKKRERRFVEQKRTMIVPFKESQRVVAISVVIIRRVNIIVDKNILSALTVSLYIWK